nr:immunoglobulin light chain junction region [Macaca mulatta]MOW44924.1 immunoglobulin light chain junction region [Macaca mulatta]
CQQHDNFPYSF